MTIIMMIMENMVTMDMEIMDMVMVIMDMLYHMEEEDLK
jgi:hypothetical protein